MIYDNYQLTGISLIVTIDNLIIFLALLKIGLLFFPDDLNCIQFLLC
jgi:hypothetical protein